MKLRLTTNISEIGSEQLCNLERRVNAVVRVDGILDGRSYSRFELTKVPGWKAALTEAVTGEAKRITQGFGVVGTDRIACLSIPFWLADGSNIGYVGKVLESAVTEMILNWAPFDYIIAGFTSSDDLTAIILVTMDDGAIFLGPDTFVVTSLGDPEEAWAEFHEVASLDPRADELIAIEMAVREYNHLSKGSIGVP